MSPLAKLIDERKNSNKNEQKVQLSMGVNFMCITDKEKSHSFHVKSDNEEFILGSYASDIINELVKSFLSNYQKEYQILRNSSDYTYDSVDMLGIHFHGIELKREKSYIKSPDWLFSKRTTINPKNNKDNKCFQYPITVALNHREIGKDSQRISTIRPHINKYNWKDIDFPAGISGWEKFERSNQNIALNILYAPHNKKEIKLVYKSKYDCKRKNQVVLVMITDNKQ